MQMQRGLHTSQGEDPPHSSAWWPVTHTRWVGACPADAHTSSRGGGAKVCICPSELKAD